MYSVKKYYDSFRTFKQIVNRRVKTFFLALLTKNLNAVFYLIVQLE